MTKAKKLRPQLARMYAVLKDGKPHSRVELRAELNDELSEHGVTQAISDLRKHLRPKRDILVQYVGHKFFYRLVCTIRHRT